MHWDPKHMRCPVPILLCVQFHGMEYPAHTKPLLVFKGFDVIVVSSPVNRHVVPWLAWHAPSAVI